MQNQLDGIKTEITRRIYILFMEKYEGNKLSFAKSVSFDEKTIRLIFNNNQWITLNLFFKIAKALDVEATELIKDLKL